MSELGRFRTDATCDQGSFNPTPASSFPDGLPDGVGSAWLNTVGYLAQVLGDALEADKDYRLSAFVGVRAGNGSSPHSYSVQLLADGVLLAEVTGTITAPEHGDLTRIKVIFRSPEVVDAGQLLEVRLAMTEDGPQLAYDLVELVACEGGTVTRNPFRGTWTGTFSGDDSGTWTMNVEADGDITGFGDSDEDGRFDLAGTTNINGTAAAGITGTNAVWGGTFTGTTLSGTWANPTFGDIGTFTGTKQ